MAVSKRAVHVVGVGMIPFTKPGASESYNLMGARAAKLALDDAGVPYDAVQQAYVGYVYGDSTAGQAAIYGVGLTGIPVFNLNNNCSTGSSALYLARQAVESGMVECAIALGFEEMVPGPLKGAYQDRPAPMARFVEVMTAHQGYEPAAPRAAQFFGGAGMDYMKQYGIRPDTFGRISVRRANMLPATRWRCSARRSRSKRSWPRPPCLARSRVTSAARPPAARRRPSFARPTLPKSTSSTCAW